MTLAELKAEQIQLALRRAQARDIVDECETGLGVLAFTIKTLEEHAAAEVVANDDVELEGM
jgi:hypothetical protein